MALDPKNVLDKAIESVAGGLAQVRHSRYHQKEQLTPETKVALDSIISKLGDVLNDMATLEIKNV